MARLAFYNRQGEEITPQEAMRLCRNREMAAARIHCPRFHRLLLDLKFRLLADMGGVVYEYTWKGATGAECIQVFQGDGVEVSPAQWSDKGPFYIYVYDRHSAWTKFTVRKLSTLRKKLPKLIKEVNRG